MVTQLPGFRSRVRAEIEALEAGEALLIEAKDWPQKTHSPSRMVHQVEVALKRKYSCDRLIDKSGWLVRRSE